MVTRKRILALAVVSIFLLSVGVYSAFAFSQWRYCEVTEIGPAGGTVTYIQLVDTATPPAWVGPRYFVLNQARAKEMLGVGLTAISLNKTIRVQIPDGPNNGFAANSVVNVMFLAQ